MVDKAPLPSSSASVSASMSAAWDTVPSRPGEPTLPHQAPHAPHAPHAGASAVGASAGGMTEEGQGQGQQHPQVPHHLHLQHHHPRRNVEQQMQEEMRLNMDMHRRLVLQKNAQVRQSVGDAPDKPGQYTSDMWTKEVMIGLL
jgi:hypothetical protein